MKAFFGKPSLGGVLAMANGLAWVGWHILVPRELLPDALMLGVAVVLAFPFALPLLVPRLHHDPTTVEIVLICIVIGLNAFAWGYGVAWLWRNVFRRYSLLQLLGAVTLSANLRKL